jgi:uncharacterized protein YukE
MAFLGMDIEAALRHASALEHQAAGEVFNVISAMTGIVPPLMEIWKGEDAQRFEQEWEVHRKDLTLLHGSLSDLVSSLHHSIAEQQQASGGY